MNISNDDLPPINVCLPISQHLKERMDRALASGEAAPLVVRLVTFPARVAFGLLCIGERPGVVWIIGHDMVLACRKEEEEILRGMNVALSTTESGKALSRKWEHLLGETGSFLVEGLVRAILGGGWPSQRLRRLVAIESEAQFSESRFAQWLDTSAIWPTARHEARFRRWYDAKNAALGHKWKDLVEQTTVVWGESVKIFGEVAAQLRVAERTFPTATIAGRIRAKWEKVQYQAESYLKSRPKEEWPESQNKFARLVGISSTTLKKAIERSPSDSLLRAWDSQKEAWGRSKRRSRTDDANKPAVISLHDAPALISGPSNDVDEVEARDLVGHCSRDELTDMLMDLFEKVVCRMPATGKSKKDMLRELDVESKEDSEIARLIVTIRQQYRDMFDDDPEAKFRQRRKP